MDMMSFIDGAKIWSLVGVSITFALIVVYALWPGMKQDFDEAAHLPLTED